MDPSGAVIPHAVVSVHGMRAERTGYTNGVGRFVVRVPKGSYDLQIDAPGFAEYRRPDLLLSSRPLEVKITLKVAVAAQEVTVPIQAGLSTDASANKSALVFSGAQLDTFSDSPSAMEQQLEAMAGSDPGNAAQLYVDGFSNGTMPPKQSIREVRINQNPFSAQSDEFGLGRIEVFTKPGSNKLHGSLEFFYGNSALNARNPYTGAQPPYSNDYTVASVDGPLGKKSSFFLTGQRSDLSENGIVNAVMLDANLNPVTTSEPVANEVVMQDYSGRIDHQFGPKDTFVGRYTFDYVTQPDAGTGLLVLPSEGYSNQVRTQTLQLTETHLFGEKIALDSRLQYLRTRLRQDPVSSEPTLIVEGAFSGGGNPQQSLHDNQDNLELQEYLTVDEGKHLIRTGVRYRLRREANLVTAGYNGQFIFPDITTYRNTLLDLQNGLSGSEIRANGDGASQFSLTAGEPSASLITGDVGVYAEDEWKARANLTLTYGLRMESQSAIPDHLDAGPRLGASYSIQPKKSKQPALVLRGGFGVFFKRFAESDLLTSVRENGLNEQVYFIENPDFYPMIPTPSSLGVSTDSTIYRVSPRLHAPVQLQGMIEAEHAFGKYGTLAVSYYPRRQYHELDSRNANAPMPGTGVRPYGGTQNVYEFSSDGISRGQDVNINGNVNLGKWVDAWAFFSINHDKTDVGGADSFVSNSYDVGADYGDYANFTPRKFFSGVNVHPGWGGALNLFFVARSQGDFNITTGEDNNGDSIYNDRPAFATDLSRPSVVHTAFGNFDTDPLAGQTIIPMNYGRAPSFNYLEIFAHKDVSFGPRPAIRRTSAGAAAKGKRMASEAPRPYRLQFGLEVDNVLNTNNPGAPVGVLTSPFFGKAISLNAPFTGNTAANRAVTLRAAFLF